MRDVSRHEVYRAGGASQHSQERKIENDRGLEVEAAKSSKSPDPPSQSPHQRVTPGSSLSSGEDKEGTSVLIDLCARKSERFGLEYRVESILQDAGRPDPRVFALKEAWSWCEKLLMPQVSKLPSMPQRDR